MNCDRKNILLLAPLKNRLNCVPSLSIAIFLFWVFILIQLPFYQNTSYNGDAARYVQNAFGILNSKMPYRDFWDILPPGESYIPAIIFRIFGLNINYIQLSFVIYGGLIGSLAYIVSKLISKRNDLSITIALIVYFNATLAPYLVFLMFTVWLFLKFLELKKRSYLFFTGITIAIALICRFYESGALLFSITIILMLNSKNYQNTLKTFSANFIFLLVGICVVFLPILYLFREINISMFNMVVMESIIHTNADYVRLPYFTSAVTEIENLGISLSQLIKTFNPILLVRIIMVNIAFIKDMLLYLLPILIIIITYKIIHNRIFSFQNRMIFLLFFIWGIATMPKVFGRASLGHLYYATVPLYFLFNFAVLVPKLSLRKITIPLCISIIILLTSFPLHISNKISMSLRSKYTLKTDFGTLNLNNKQEYRDIVETITYITSNSTTKNPIFVLPFTAPPFYILTQRNNTTYYNTTLDLLTLPTNNKQNAVCQSLVSKDVKIIVDYPLLSREGDYFRLSNPLLRSCIDQNYKIAKEMLTYRLLIPK